MPSLNRPDTLEGFTVKKKGNCVSIYVTVGLDANNNICESIIKAGKAGGCVSAWVELTGRLMSRALSRGDTVEALIDELKGIKCGQGENSCPDCIAKAIQTLIDKGLINGKENTETSMEASPTDNRSGAQEGQT